MNKILVALFLILSLCGIAIACEGPNCVNGKPLQLTGPDPASYVTIGDMKLVDWQDKLFEFNLRNAQFYIISEKMLESGKTVLAPKLRYLREESRVEGFKYSGCQTEECLQNVVSRDLDMPDRILLKFELKISDTLRGAIKQTVKYHVFAGVIQSDTNNGTQGENFRVLGIGGILSEPVSLNYTACATVVKQICKECVQRACSRFDVDTKIFCNDWDNVTHETRLDEDYLDRPVYGRKCDNPYWGNWGNGQCPNPNGYPHGAIACESNKDNPQHQWRRRYQYQTCHEHELIGYNWCTDRWVDIQKQRCTEYDGICLEWGQRVTYEDKCVINDVIEVKPICNTYATFLGRGFINYFDITDWKPYSTGANDVYPVITWRDGMVKFVNGQLRGIVPGDYSFIIPLVTKGNPVCRDID